MRFLVDANLSARVAAWLRSRGHDAAHVFDLDLAEGRDEQILARAAEESRILLTADSTSARSGPAPAAASVS